MQEFKGQQDLIDWMREAVPTRWFMAGEAKRHFPGIPIRIEGNCVHVFGPKNKFWGINEALAISQGKGWKGHSLFVPREVRNEIWETPKLMARIRIVEDITTKRQIYTFYGLPIAIINDVDMWLVDSGYFPPKKDRIIRVTWPHESDQEKSERIKNVSEGGVYIGRG